MSLVASFKVQSKVLNRSCLDFLGRETNYQTLLSDVYILFCAKSQEKSIVISFLDHNTIGDELFSPKLSCGNSDIKSGNGAGTEFRTASYWLIAIGGGAERIIMRCEG